MENYIWDILNNKRTLKLYELSKYKSLNNKTWQLWTFCLFPGVCIFAAACGCCWFSDFSELIPLCVATEVCTCLAFWLANDWRDISLNA